MSWSTLSNCSSQIPTTINPYEWDYYGWYYDYFGYDWNYWFYDWDYYYYWYNYDAAWSWHVHCSECGLTGTSHYRGCCCSGPLWLKNCGSGVIIWCWSRQGPSSLLKHAKKQGPTRARGQGPSHLKHAKRAMTQGPAHAKKQGPSHAKAHVQEPAHAKAHVQGPAHAKKQGPAHAKAQGPAHAKKQGPAHAKAQGPAHASTTVQEAKAKLARSCRPYKISRRNSSHTLFRDSLWTHNKN